MKKRKNKGFTLIEIMIAIVVFSFGLLGVAGVMTVAVKSNYNGYMRSQANFLASSMLDAMRKNIKAVWVGSYDASVEGYVDISTSCVSGCNYLDLATRDLQFWSNNITQILPSSKGKIECVQNGGLQDSSGLFDKPFYAVQPYSGICTITITWAESNETSADSVQTFILPGKP
jgi:type IV pilus assembly protein PilV